MCVVCMQVGCTCCLLLLCVANFVIWGLLHGWFVRNAYKGTSWAYFWCIFILVGCIPRVAACRHGMACLWLALQ